MLYNFGKFISFLAAALFYSFKVSGQKNVPKKGGFILVANHVSYLDPLIIGAACPRKLNFMAKQELFKNKLFSHTLSCVGAFPVKRNSADGSALKEAIRRLRSGKGLVLFPEGSRGFESARLQPQAGVGFLAARVDVPLIPAYIKGTDNALPKNAKFLKSAKISVRFGEKVEFDKTMPYDEIAQKVMNSVGHLAH